MKIKKLIASLATATLAVTSVVTPFVANAGEMLGQTDFNDGVGLPWHTCETSPGKCSFDISEGTYNLKIENPGGSSRGGEDRWDIQFRHRGLQIVSGNTYTMKYELTPSNKGQFYTKVGSLEGEPELWHNGSTGQSDFGQTWELISVAAGETYSGEVTWTASESMEVAEWAFHLGGSGQYTPQDCFPEGTVIKFDNMSMVCNESDAYDYKEDPHLAYFSNHEEKRNKIMVNQVGYFPAAEKKATYVTSSTSATEFTIVDVDGKTVYTGKSTPFGADKDSGDSVQILDFSDFKDEGTGYSIKCGSDSSYSFNIGNWIYDGLLADSINYFYQNRSAIAIESSYITSGDASSLARAAGHTADTAIIQTEWSNTATLSGTTQDVTGGWYDAGDHGKYVVNGGISLWTLQNEYEMAVANGYDKTFADGALKVPENSNGYPDLLDEARWEMEWFMTMEVKSGTYKGMVYHKMHDESWTALALAPADDEKERIIKPPSTCATFNASACAAQAARLWKGIDDAFADKCLAFAKSTYAAGKANPKLYAPLDQNIGGGPYGDTDATDEQYWAACELFATTGDDTYYNDMKGSDHHLVAYTALNSGEDSGTIGCMNWGNTSILGLMSLYLNEDKVPAADFTTIKSNFAKAADTLIGYQDKQGYGINITQSTSNAETGYEAITGYPWGSNSFVVCNTILFAYAFEATGEAKYFNAASESMDYIFGRNPLDFSYVSGYGTFRLTYPHHRWWSYLIDKQFPMAPSGVLSGGPNSTLQDPWVKGSGWIPGTRAPQICFMDHIEAWSVNECTVNWNAPLTWVTAYLQENVSKLDGEDPILTDVLYGDVVIDGNVDLKDLVKLSKYNAKLITLTEQEMLNADVMYDSQVDLKDLVKLSKYIAKLIKQSELGPKA